MLLGRCEFGKDDYSFKIINMPADDAVEVEEDSEETGSHQSKRASVKSDDQPSLF